MIICYNDTMELWDIYDKDGLKTGKQIHRGERLSAGEYHLIVAVWIKNGKNEFLVQKRAKHVKDPLMWHTTMGNVKAGENSYDAALREAREELGIDVGMLPGRFFSRTLYEEDGQKYWCDSFLCFADFIPSLLHLQKKEVKEAGYMKMPEIKRRMAEGSFFVYDLDYLDELERAEKTSEKTCDTLDYFRKCFGEQKSDDDA